MASSVAHMARVIGLRSRSGNIAVGLMAASMERVRMARWAFAAQAPMSSIARMGICTSLAVLSAAPPTGMVKFLSPRSSPATR